ncbi:oxalate/formate MFS antiporter [Acidithiobacillus ferrianus]|uniref:Oxalate/formate MFS antiporter n=2 Tax=Acidithiobacillus ferrianus TaxID=2678518 RepID=A0A845U7Z4_9PROT|nr:oxalate/formate MFS antiporter [Acidithiobacillus ferrianus]NDU43802.1 oxalate/formate MFS antiporter [Acidithiobacillus ferrianus]
MPQDDAFGNLQKDAIAPVGILSSRWSQLLLSIICMMAIASPQYVWALFTTPLLARFGVSLAVLQVTFTLLVVIQTFFSPLQGFLVDRFGARSLLSIGTMITGLSWVLSAAADNVYELYLGYGLLGGLGTGIVYVGVIGHIARWFPDKRGFALGMVAAGYGFGAVLTTFPISSSLGYLGYTRTLTIFGLILGAIGFISAQGIRKPEGSATSEVLPEPVGIGLTPKEMLRKPIFWIMFVMMAMMSTSGLMVISQMGAFAQDFGVSGALVFGVAALPLALTIDRITNGLTRPFFGWLSDVGGRENIMAVAFGMEALAMIAWLYMRHDPLLFVLLSGVVFFGWGEIFSLFPSTLTDTFGTRHATTNYGCLYLSQGIGSVVGGPVAALIYTAYASWVPVFLTMIFLDALAALMALFVLKKYRTRYLHAMRGQA